MYPQTFQYLQLYLPQVQEGCLKLTQQETFTSCHQFNNPLFLLPPNLPDNQGHVTNHSCLATMLRHRTPVGLNLLYSLKRNTTKSYNYDS